MRTTFITVNMKKWGIDATVVITFIHLAGFKSLDWEIWKLKEIRLLAGLGNIMTGANLKFPKPKFQNL